MMTSFTDDPTHLPTVVFPNSGMQSLSSVIHLLGVSVLGYCFARRTTFPDLSWSQLWSTITWPRLCVILVLADSWIFVFLSGVLVLGAGLSKDDMSCSLGIYACIALYVLSKILTYGFLIEKVHVVWGGAHQPRLKSPVYRICLITVTPYVVVIALMLLGRIAFIRNDGACVIGLKRLASLTLLIYDLYINIFLTGLFIWPLARSKLINPRLKSVAVRTLVAAFAALTTSTLNIAILTVMDGRQLGWVCLGSCGTDVTINAIVLFWVTSPTSSTAVTHSGPQPTNGTSFGPDAQGATITNRRASNALVVSSAPRSPITPNTPGFHEKTQDPGLLSPSTWRAKFGSMGKNQQPTIHSEDYGQRMEMVSRTPSPRREVWDDRPSSIVMVDDIEANPTGPGYVTIGAPPPSKKRNAGRTRAGHGVHSSQHSGSRNSILGRIFGASESQRDMEVTVTITTQLEHEEEPEGSVRKSIGETSTAGGSTMIKQDFSTENLNTTKP
ncbi:hypothetical protein ACGC1H_004522 [Rhizoctonia solani]|uniref:Transmembrane protein n=1 Tax=Rhizoctonia solani TaxID=456999 RepID=A0A8H2XVV5_9AGAM|nr:unnamed protein product [Rhizoctonia solani]